MLQNGLNSILWRHFNANCLEAAVIMLGLSSEKIIDEQVDSLLVFCIRIMQLNMDI